MDTETNQEVQEINGTYNELSALLMKKGVFLPEHLFIKEEYFKQERKEDIEVYLDDYVTAGLKEENKEFIVINAKYLSKEGAYRKMIYSVIEKRFPDYVAFSLYNKNYIMIVIKDEFYEKIKVMQRDQLQYYIDLIYLKLYNKLDFTHEEKQELEFDEKQEEELKKQRLHKEQQEKEEEEKNIYLPIVQKLEIFGHSHNSVEIKIPKIDIKTVISKNRDYIRGFARKYENHKIFYVVFLYDETLGKYTEFYQSEKNTFKLENLKSNKMHLIKVALKLDKFYSQLSKSSVFHTKMHPENEGRKNNYYAWGNNTLNYLLINPTISSESSSEFYPTPCRLPNNKVVDFTSSYDSTFLLLSTHQVISSGKFYAVNKNNGEVDSDFDNEKADNISSFNGNPYEIIMPLGVSIRKISCGLDFCVAVDIVGGVYSWGTNDLGQLGLNVPYDVIVNKPKKVSIKYEDSEDVFAVDVQAGSKHVLCSVIANEKMRLFSWGLGQGVEPVFQAKEGVPEWMIDTKLTKLTNAFSPMLIKFPLSHKIVKIISAFNVNAIICNEDSHEHETINTVYTFGGVNSFQLGLDIDFPESIHQWGFPTLVNFFPKNNLSVLDVSFSESHTLFLVKNLISKKNEIYSCGLNDHNQTGFNEKISVMPQKIHFEIFDLMDNEPIMVAAGKRQSAVLTKNHKIFIFGITDFKSKQNEFNGDKIRELTEFKLKTGEKINKLKVMKNSIAILTSEN